MRYTMELTSMFNKNAAQIRLCCDFDKRWLVIILLTFEALKYFRIKHGDQRVFLI